MKQQVSERPLAAASRRQVMLGAAGLTFALAIGVDGYAGAGDLTAERGGRAIGPWVSIGRDGTIAIMSPATEMGQGSMTSLPLIIAEELDADWSKVRVIPAPPDETKYNNPGFGDDKMMYTADSNAVRSYYSELRFFGAQVRRVLLDNAAAMLGVPVDELTTQPSTVMHVASDRSLSYGEIAAVAEIPAQLPHIEPEELKRPDQFRLITKDVMRIDVPSKVNGTAQYSIDVQVPNMVYGAVLRAPVEGSVPDKIDDSKAKAVAGVIGVIRMPWGVGVIGQSPWAAFEGRQALEKNVTWSRTGTAWGLDSDERIKEFAADVKDPKKGATEWSHVGDAREEMMHAATIMEAEYLCDYAYHAQMEPLNAVAAVSPNADSVEIWCGIQSQTIAREAPARLLGISPEQVTLHDMLMGGAFGRRGNRDADFVLDAVWLSKEAGLPVKVMWTRADDVHNGRFRPISANYVKAGFDSAGKLVAWHHRIAVDRVKPFSDPDRYESSGGKDSIVMRGTDLAGYDVKHQLVEQLYRNTGVRTSPLRGIGYTANRFATEAFLNEIARKRGVDPVTYRLGLLTDLRGKKVIERVAQMADWVHKRNGRGLGFAYLDYSRTKVAGIAEVSLDAASGQIKVHEFWCAIDCGIAVQPDNVVAQTEGSIVYGLGLALTETISIKNGSVVQRNFHDYRIPRLNQVPQIHVDVIASRDSPCGVGQMATPLVAPAIADAVAELRGTQLRHAPFTPDRVKKAMS